MQLLNTYKVTVYLSYSSFLFFYLNQISFLLMTSPVTWYRCRGFFVGVKGYLRSYYFSDYYLSFCSFYFALLCLFIKSSTILLALSSPLACFSFSLLLDILALSRTRSPTEFFWKYTHLSSGGYYYGFFLVRRELFEMTLRLLLSMLLMEL